jgi:hypothetical protein
MNDADLELTIHRWLDADAGALGAPAGLRRRIMDLPAQPMPATHWWHRFASLPAMSGAVVSAGAVGVLVASMFFGLFDAPAGTDGEPCNNRQVQHAIDNLRDADGYRYVNRDQLRELDPSVELDFDNPQYAWTDAWVSEGAYLAPDRAHDVPVTTLPALFNRGYSESVHVGGARYELREIDGTPTWVRSTNWPTANLAYGYVMGAFPTFSIPGVNSLDFGGTQVPADVPGTGGCTAAALIPAIDPGVPTAIPIERRIVALRIDVGTERPVGIYLGPEIGGLESDGQARSTWELTWETPSPDEFQAPAESIEDPNLVEQSFVPDPVPSPLPVDPSALAPIELSSAPNAGVSDVAAGDGLFVAVGGEYAGAEISALVWTSTDGATWDLIDSRPEFDGRNFESVEWNGSTFLAIAYRNYESPEGPQFSTARPESWLSTDGVTWELGGGIGPDEESGEVANPGRPIVGGPGWMASGSIWSLADNQQRPAIFASADGVRWDTIELEGTGTGSIGQMVEMPDGTLFATGCESPGSTNSGSSGQGCYMRQWLSDDGLVWTPGPMIDVEIQQVARWGDRLLAIASEGDPSQQDDPFTTPPDLLMTSDDGVTWSPLEGLPTGTAGPTGLAVLRDEIVVIGQLLDMNFQYATAWRSADGETWEPIGLGLPADAVSSYVVGAVDTPSGLALLGQAQVGETGSVALLWLEP